MSLFTHISPGGVAGSDADRPANSFQIATSERERHQLKRAAQTGAIQRMDRGLYLVNPAAYGPYHELAAVAIRRPDVVICLASAAAFHGLTSSPPAAV